MSNNDGRQQQRRERREKGLCYECDAPALPDRVLCEKHGQLNRKQGAAYRDRHREQLKARYEQNKKRYSERAKERRRQRKAQGLCVRCKRPALPGRVRCLIHAERSRRKCAEYKKRHREIVNGRQRLKREERCGSGVCIDCGKTAVRNQVRCDEHRAKSLERGEKWKEHHKEELSALINWPSFGELKSIGGRPYARAKDRYSHAKASAKFRGREWALSQEQYYTLWVMRCFYCDLPNTVEAGVGLDRLDNALGYRRDNVVSCCTQCNHARNRWFTPHEMRRIGAAIREVKLAREQVNVAPDGEVLAPLPVEKSGLD